MADKSVGNKVVLAKLSREDFIKLQKHCEVKDESLSSTTRHTVRLSQLESGSTYHARLIGKDTDGEEFKSDDYTFTTGGISKDRNAIKGASSVN